MRADILWSQTTPELVHMLVTQAGWPADRDESWLADALKAMLLS